MIRSIAFVITLIFGQVADAAIFDTYKAQNGGEPFAFAESGADAILTWHFEIARNTRSQEICAVRIFKNGVNTGVSIDMKPIKEDAAITMSWTDTNYTSGTDSHQLQLESCPKHFHPDENLRRNHRHPGLGRNYRHTELINPVGGAPVDPPPDLLANIDTSGNLDTRDTSVTPLAFPGATGPAMFSSGGRGGEVYTINTIDDVSVNGDGLISWAEFINADNEVQSHARTAVFSVSGIIDIGTRTDVSLTDSNVSILCHSAPSPGIVFVGMQSMSLKHNSDNIHIRFCKFKPKDTFNAGNNTTVRLINSSPSSIGATDDIYIDHISGMYGTDDGITFWQNTDETKNVPSNITIAHSLLGEGATTCLRTDNECGSSSTNTGQEDWRFPSHSAAITLSSRKSVAIQDAAVVANIMINTWARAPQIRSVTGADVRNNWIPNNYGTAVTLNQASGPSTVAPTGWITGNRFKHGPDTTNPENTLNLSGGDVRYIINDNQQITYPAGGVGQGVQTEIGTNPTTTLPGNPIRYTDVGNNQIFVDANNVPSCIGASVPFRDASDTRLISEVNGLNTDSMLASAEIGIGTREPYDNTKCGGPQCFYFAPGVDGQGQRNYSDYVGSNSHPAGYDTDGDGIPDSFENDVIALGIGYNTLADIDETTYYTDGYTFFEKAMNRLAASCALSS